MEQTGLPTNHTNARAWITDVAGKMWQFWLCLCCCHLADQLAHCMIWERVLQCFTCESKQVDPFHPPFSKVKLWRDTRKHPYRSNGRGKAYSLKEKQTKPSAKHNYILSLPMQLPEFPSSTTLGLTYLIPPANPIWCRRLGGGFNILRVPAIFSYLPHIHYC